MALNGFKAAMTEKVSQAATKEENVKTPTRTERVGMGLLNQASLAEKKVEEFPLISVDDIIPNEKNKYEINEIEELMESIVEVGLLQPVVGYYLEDGKFKLTSGERRWTACKRLVTRGYAEFKKIPAKIQKLEDIDLPLTDDLKEKYSIISTNKERRNNLSPAELLFEVETLREIYAALDEAGYKPAGKRRALIAKDLGVSEQTVARMTNISLHATDEVKEALTAGEIDLQTTQELAKESSDVQKKTLERLLDDSDLDSETEDDLESAPKKSSKKKAKEIIEDVKLENEIEKEVEDVEQIELKENDVSEVIQQINQTNEKVTSAIGKTFQKETKKHLATDLKKLMRLLQEIELLLD